MSGEGNGRAPGADNGAVAERPPRPLSDEERSAAFAASPRTGLAPGAPPVDRAAAFAAGVPKLPRRYVYWAVTAVAVLGLGGLGLEHVFSSAGLNPRQSFNTAQKPPPLTTPSASTTAPGPAATSATTPGATTPGATTPGAGTGASLGPGPAGAASLGASLPAFMGLETLPAHPAPTFSLTNQNGSALSLGAQRGHVVVLSFFDGPCDDICPLLANELRQADTLLGTHAAEVTFLTVNTDPRATAASALAPAAASSGLGTLPNWQMLTGPLGTLDQVWRRYGISISVTVATGAVVHNDLLYFIDPAGDLRYRATPVANESRNGAYSLPAADTARWAQGIAAYASRLLVSR